MKKFCPLCAQEFRQGDLVELIVVAPYHEIESNVAFSIGTPVDAYPDSLVHSECSKSDAELDN